MWNVWSLSRGSLLFTGLAFLLIFIQVTLFHYRQNFRSWAMWIPVLGTPIIGLAVLWLLLSNSTRSLNVIIVLLWVGFVAGLFGFLVHFRGVGQRVGGYKLMNFLVGPPVILPLMVTAFSTLGLIAIHWR